MKVAAACVLILTCIVHGEYHREEFRRVTGGMPVRIEDYPHVVGLWLNKNSCTASIIGSRTILTSAHCFDKIRIPRLMYVYVGSAYIFSNESVRYRILDFAIHPEYVQLVPDEKKSRRQSPKNELTHDIALMYLTTKIVFGPRAQPAPLVNTDKWMNPKYKNFEIVALGKTALESGTSFEGLQRTIVRYVSHEECSKLRYLSIAHLTAVTKDMACFISESGKSVACNGDSGSSILWKGQIVGVASHYRGPPCNPSSYSVYCNVFMMRGWINKTIKGFKKKYN